LHRTVSAGVAAAPSPGGLRPNATARARTFQVAQADRAQGAEPLARNPPLRSSCFTGGLENDGRLANAGPSPGSFLAILLRGRRSLRGRLPAACRPYRLPSRVRRLHARCAETIGAALDRQCFGKVTEGARRACASPHGNVAESGWFPERGILPEDWAQRRMVIEETLRH